MFHLCGGKSLKMSCHRLDGSSRVRVPLLTDCGIPEGRLTVLLSAWSPESCHCCRQLAMHLVVRWNLSLSIL